LAGLVRAQTAAMREGLNELAVVAPEILGKEKGKWLCGDARPGDGVQILDSVRYRQFVDDLKRYWENVNPFRSDPPFSMSGKDGIAIRSFLNDCKNWTQEDWRKALNNRKVSVIRYQAASRSEPMYAWVRNLSSYATGYLDRFGKPVEGSEKHGKTVSIQHGNREAGDSFLDRVRARESSKGNSDQGVFDEVRSD